MKKTIAIIGGGPAAMLLAAFLDPLKWQVNIYEKNKSVGRKFLVAGKGGFNLTHSENLDSFVGRYTPSHLLEVALRHFSNVDFRDWLESIGVPTFVGSSKRVFPEKGIKPITVLKAILNVLENNGVKINYGYEWIGWDSNQNLVFNNDKTINADYVVFSLGGASWKVTGSGGNQLNVFQENGHEYQPFQASNCCFKIEWPKEFVNKHEAQPLKNIAIRCLDKEQKGEVVVTALGLEGNGIYALSPQIRAGLNNETKADIFIDLKPTLSLEILIVKIKTAQFKNTTETLRKAVKLSEAQIGLVKHFLSKEAFLDPNLLAENIKNLNLTIVGTADIDEAISTVGGIHLNAIDEHFQLKNLKRHYCIGEMLDWDAPTGGYLIQGCVSMGVYLAGHLNEIG